MEILQNKKSKKSLTIKMVDSSEENLVSFFSFVFDVAFENTKKFDYYFLSEIIYSEESKNVSLTVTINNVEDNVMTLLHENLDSIAMMWKLGASKATLQ